MGNSATRFDPRPQSEGAFKTVPDGRELPLLRIGWMVQSHREAESRRWSADFERYEFYRFFQGVAELLALWISPTSTSTSPKKRLYVKARRRLPRRRSAQTR